MILQNGTVLPHGLLDVNGYEAKVAAFNQSYRNTGLKAGFVIASYAANDPNNKSKLCTEYDVQTIEQHENKGSTSILYKNCLSSQGFGSIADYLEYTLRSLEKQTSTGFPTFSGQNGAIVLIRCLDDCGDQGIVVGSLIHPDRPTTITTTDPQLHAEYNGVQVQVNTDGSTSLTFQGATDNDGNVINPGNGITNVRIEADGSFQIQNSKTTLRMDNTSGTVSVKASANLEMAVSGNVSITVNGDTTLNTSGTTTITSEKIVLNKEMSGITTAQSHQNVIDLITGTPVIPSTSTFGDV